MNTRKTELRKQLAKFKERYITLNLYQFDVDIQELANKMEEAIGEKAIEALIAKIPADQRQVKGYYRKVEQVYEKTVAHLVPKITNHLTENDLAFMDKHFEAYVRSQIAEVRETTLQTLCKEIAELSGLFVKAKMVIYDSKRKKYFHVVTHESMEYIYEILQLKSIIKNKRYLKQRITPNDPKKISELHRAWRTQERRERDKQYIQQGKSYAGGYLEVEDITKLKTSLTKQDTWEIVNGQWLAYYEIPLANKGYRFKQNQYIPIPKMVNGTQLKEQVQATRYTKEDEKYIEQQVAKAIENYLQENNRKHTTLPEKIIHEKINKLLMNLRFKERNTYVEYNSTTKDFTVKWTDELQRYIKREIVYLCKVSDETEYNKPAHYEKDKIRMNRLRNALKKLDKPMLGTLRLKITESGLLPEFCIKHRESYLFINPYHIIEKEGENKRVLFMDKERLQPMTESLNILRIWLMGREGGKEVYEMYRQSIDLRVREVVLVDNKT